MTMTLNHSRLLVLLLCFCVPMRGQAEPPPSVLRSYKSPDEFVSLLKDLHPPQADAYTMSLFRMADLDAIGEEKSPAYTAPTVRSVTLVWHDDAQALVFVTASPPFKSTSAAVGIVFVLTTHAHLWQITGLRRFEACGKYAEVTCELTANAGTGYHLGESGMPPIITIRRDEGGRGYSYTLSRSLRLANSALEEAF